MKSAPNSLPRLIDVRLARFLRLQPDNQCRFGPHRGGRKKFVIAVDKPRRKSKFGLRLMQSTDQEQI